jgi:TRAP-type C4-dicarboxylate transport system substrate-binding protein
MRDGPAKKHAYRLVLAVVVAACGGTGDNTATDTSAATPAGASEVDRAGGAGLEGQTVLTLAQPNLGGPFPQLIAWAEEVSRLSGGTLRIAFADWWRLGETLYEADTIGDVQNGLVDLAWVGARAFDTVGYDGFQPLLAPLLVDSYELQDAVFGSAIPEEMLRGLETIDVVGIAVLPGPMRKVLGIQQPLLRPEDFVDMVVGVQDSNLASDSLMALGATPQAVPASASLDGLDGYEQQLGSIVGNNYHVSAGYVTANINLWPRPLVIIANPTTFDSLTQLQQSALLEAGASILADASTALRKEDDTAMPVLCASMTVATASNIDLAALLTAFEPMYADLAAKSGVASHLEAITDIKDDLAAGAESPECPAQSEVEASVGFPEGTYRSSARSSDFAAACGPGEGPGADSGEPVEGSADDLEFIFEVTFHAGILERYYFLDGERVLETVWTYQVFRDRIEISDTGGGTGTTARWETKGNNLVFSDVVGQFCDDTPYWSTNPWQPVASGDSSQP